MHFYSTRNTGTPVDFSKAALDGIAADGGLYIPEQIPELSSAVRNSLASMDFHSIAFEVAKLFVCPDISQSALMDMVQDAYPFTAPLVAVGDRGVMELFHGPTAAFKDFGARFMARSFAYLRRSANRKLRILVATSGDTGGAVADGFYGLDTVDVTVLYPKGRVSPLQERQIAGLGKNVSAFAVKGSFDDCQALVKAAFADTTLKAAMDLSSANSINISRLVPQIIYYVAASGRAVSGLSDPDGEATPRVRDAANCLRNGPVCFCVPSGNFGNLTAGLYAKGMGAPIASFIAATNANKTVPEYLQSGEYRERPSLATISNAMDVGAPSNFERMQAHWAWDQLKKIITGYSVSDDDTRGTIKQVFDEHGYILDPHSAVGWRAIDCIEKDGGRLDNPVLAATAHPAKFSEIVEPIVGAVPVPPSLRHTMERTVQAGELSNSLVELREALLALPT